MTTTNSAPTPAFAALSADNADDQLTEIDSLCMNCYQQGRTRLLLTKIPYYKDVILSSFECESCHFKNNDIQPAQRIEPYGISIKVQVLNVADLNRQLVKSSYGTVRIKELDFEQAPVGENGLLTTIEGFLSSVVENLQKTIRQIDERLEEIDKKKQDNSSNENDQEENQFLTHKEKLIEFINRVENLRTVSESFHFEIDDPSGNSFIENPKAPYRDEQMVTKQYRRSAEQRAALGENDEDEKHDETEEKTNSTEIKADEILTFRTNCNNCNAPCDTNMKVTNIPHFKEVIIMATTCDVCGDKSNEVKSGTGIAPKGVRYILTMTDPTDLNRDILVSETSSFEIPDLDFELNSSRSIGGRFTTLEGIFTTLKTQLSGVIIPFAGGDSQEQNSDRKQFSSFIEQLSAILNGEKLVKIIVSDPAGNCYLQNIYAPDSDPNLIVEHYERTEEEDDLLGLKEMNVDHYDQS